jgi:DNA-binding GntR family transcriptional regulator
MLQRHPRKSSSPAKGKKAADGANSSEPSPRALGSHVVYASLRQAILDLELEPGSALDEVSLSEQFDMSRTPIREALVRLSGEGLVTTLPNRTTVVTPIDFVRLPAYFDALSLIYRVTTRAAAMHRRPEHLDAIRVAQADFAGAVARRDAIAMISANRDFHMAIAEAGGNPYITSFFARLLDEGRRILRLYYQTFDDRLPRQYVEEHDAIIAAIDAGDIELSDRLAAAHAAQIVQQIQSYIARETTTGLDLSR